MNRSPFVQRKAKSQGKTLILECSNYSSMSPVEIIFGVIMILIIGLIAVLVLVSIFNAVRDFIKSSNKVERIKNSARTTLGIVLYISIFGSLLGGIVWLLMTIGSWIGTEISLGILATISLLVFASSPFRRTEDKDEYDWYN